MDQRLTGKTLVAQRFARSTATYDAAAIVQRDMAHQLLELLQRATTNNRFDKVLELGCGTGLLTELLVDRFTIQHLTLNDLVPDLAVVAERCSREQLTLEVELCPGDMETTSFPGNQNLVASNAVLQWAADPDAMIDKMLDTLKPGGLLAVATFGPRNVQETVDLTGQSLPYLSLDAIRSKLDQRAEVLFCHERVASISFESAYAVLQHLKHTGANGLQHKAWSPRAVREFCQVYESRFRVDEKVPLTYHPIMVVARRRNA